MALDRSPGSGSTSSRLGVYELLKELSGGGVGSTWLARPPAEEEGAGPEPVTIFRIYRHLTKKAEVADGVLREAGLAQSVRAPNVLAVLDARVTDGEVFIVSEYSEGESLAGLLASAGMSESPRGAGAPAPAGLPQPVALRIGVDMLRALAAAHAAAPDPVTHGELNPQHARVGVDGITRVSGFGIARAIARLAPMGGKNHDRLAYAAPERVKGMSTHAEAPADPRSDLFSVGVILWEALARQRLFSSKLEAAIIQKVLTAPIPALSSMEGLSVSTALDAAIQKALERDPARRFASADEMLAAIEGSGAEIAPKEDVAALLEKLASKSIEARKTAIAAAMIGTAAGERPVTPRKRGATLVGVASPLAEAGPARGGVGSRLAITAPAPRPKSDSAIGEGGIALVKDTAGSGAAPAQGAEETAAAAKGPATRESAPGDDSPAKDAPANGSPAGAARSVPPAEIDASWDAGEEKPRDQAATLIGVEAPAAAAAAVVPGRARAGIDVPTPGKPAVAAKARAEGAIAAPAPATPASSAVAGSAAAEPPPANGPAAAREAPGAPPGAPEAAAPAKKPAPPPAAPKPPLGKGAAPIPRATPGVRAPAATVPDGPAARKAAPAAAVAAAATPAVATSGSAAAATAASAAVTMPAPAPDSAHDPGPISGLVTHTPTPTGPQGLNRPRGRAASAVDRLNPGSTLGRYEILMPVAKGGMAAVWAARLQGSRGFQKIVAVKTMLPDVSDDPDFRTMFLDEARIAARIRHPNVADILDLGEEDDVLYLVMEWVDGETVSTLQKAAKPLGGIPQRIALRIASQICAGLHNAHELRDDHGGLLDLVHRDVSPANVLISTAGFVKIVDFGVAKSKGRLHVTRAGGVVKGKTPYLSPEQLGGLPIDRRSDIFSLGALLYVLTTGLHPFRGETEMATVENIALKNPIAPRELNEALHPDFEKIIQKALEKDRALRFSTCAEMQRAIDQVASTLGEPTTDEDVADFVRQSIGTIQAKRAQDLRDAIATVDANAMALSEPRPAAAAAAAPVEAAAPAAMAAHAVIAKPPPPAAMRAPAISNSDIIDEISFEEEVAPKPLEVVHPPKLIIAPSAQPPPELAAPAESVVAVAPAAIAFDPGPPIAGTRTPLDTIATIPPDRRRKRMQGIVLGVVGACVALGVIALVAGSSSRPPEERAGTTPQAAATAQAPTAPPEPPAPTPPEPPTAQDPLAEPPPTPPPADTETVAEPQPPAPPTPPAATTRAAVPTTRPPPTRPPPTSRPPSTGRTPPKPPPKKKYDPTGI